MSAVSQTVARSIGEAAAAAPRLIERCMDGAVAALQAAEAQAPAERRQTVGDAWRAMLARREAWTTRFPSLLQQAFDADLARDGSVDAAPTSADDDSLSLTLVDDTEIAREIESARLAQQLDAMLASPLAELDPLISRALRPALYVQVLRQVMEADAERPAPGWTALWMRALRKPLARELEQLYRAQATLPAEATAAAAGVAASVASATAAASAAPAAAPGETMPDAEVVRRLLAQVAQDQRLLAPVRETLAALEPSLARLAAIAPRFFNDEAHPGRLLVERVAQRSFRYNDDAGAQFQAFLAPVAETIHRLNQIEQFRNATAFQAALAALQSEWSAQDAREQDAQRKALDILQFAERRQQEAQRIAATLRERDDLLDAPPAVQEFVLGTWTLVVAHARLAPAQDDDDPGGHLALLRDLLWSVNPHLALHEPARAFAMIPHVLLGLREGLAALGLQPAESESFFHELEKLHRPVLKLRARQRQRDLPPSEPPARVPPAAALRPPEQPWMTAEDLLAAGFEDAQLPGQQPTPAQPLPEQAVADVIAALEPGRWVDLHARQQWRRARLAWAAEQGSLFLFMSHGGKAHAITRSSLQRRVRDQLLRPVDSDGVVQRALQRLMEPAPA